MIKRCEPSRLCKWTRTPFTHQGLLEPRQVWPRVDTRRSNKRVATRHKIISDSQQQHLIMTLSGRVNLSLTVTAATQLAVLRATIYSSVSASSMLARSETITLSLALSGEFYTWFESRLWWTWDYTVPATAQLRKLFNWRLSQTTGSAVSEPVWECYVGLWSVL